MNRRDANTKSRSGELSIGELRAMIADARGRGGISKVNQALTMEQVCDIYEAALKGRDAAEKPAGRKPNPYSTNGGWEPTKDSLIIRNILRDCAT